MKRLLLDTHVLLWWLIDPQLLRPAARDAITQSDSEVFVSVAAIWERMVKVHAGRIDLPTDDPIQEMLERKRFRPLPVVLSHALRAAALPRIHGDPFDRMMTAQAVEEQLILVTRDEVMLEYEVETIEA